MDLVSAERERIVRLYNWALRDVEREVSQDYPYIRLIPGQVATIRDTIPPEWASDEVGYLKCLTRYAHPVACELLGQPVTEAETAVRERRNALIGNAIRRGIDWRDGEMPPVPDGEERMKRSVIARQARRALKPLLGPVIDGDGRLVWCHRCVVEPDWWIDTEIDACGAWETSLRGYHAFSRRDEGDDGSPKLFNVYGYAPPRHATTSLPRLFGLGAYNWPVRCQSDLDRALAAIEKIWNHFHSEIAPLIADLTIDG